ncbi:MAG: alanine:cation symporter family protein [Myxococcales bacterium]|nr:alanine:cation symporter family protein [Myxococcales bacterium]
MRTLLVLLVTWGWLTLPAHADSPAPAEAPTSGVAAAIDSADTLFADWVVGPLGALMFFDLVFWDNSLSGESAVGQVVDGEQITAVTDAGLERRALHEITSPEPLFEQPQTMTLGKLETTVRSVQRVDPDSGEKTHALLAKVDPQDVDLAAHGLTFLGAEVPEGEKVQVVVRDLAPFAIRVDRTTGQTVPSNLRIDPSLIPVQEGMTVRGPDGEAASVVSVAEDGTVTALGSTVRVDGTSVPNPKDVAIPIVVAWLVFGALFFTLRMMFVNVRMFGHALSVTAGRYDNPDDEGEISHFQALSSALSATVGLGNIAGVAIAVSVGGPGAVFWMVIAGLLGMSSKFVECTLGQMYRTTRPDGSVSGGPMHYLGDGLQQMGMGGLGRVLAVVFAIMCIGGSFGGGNMFQANQSNAAVFEVLRSFEIVSADSATMVSLVYGTGLAFVVGLVIIGGIKRIGMAAGVIVPFMCGLYVLAGLYILVANASEVPAAFGAIVSQAFSFEAGIGGFFGVLVQGFRRAAFSNEAGVGSAAIAHSAATTNEPVREGIVALLEPFIDTVIVCTMTGLVVVVTGAYLEGGDGVVMTQNAFGTASSWFPVLLSVAVMLFAFSTMISWSYYGERCTVWLFGDSMKLPYRLLFLVFVFAGANFKLGSVLDFSDLMILGMAFPNILGALFLSGKVKEALDTYIDKLRSGAFDTAGAS